MLSKMGCVRLGSGVMAGYLAGTVLSSKAIVTVLVTTVGVVSTTKFSDSKLINPIGPVETAEYAAGYAAGYLAYLLYNSRYGTWAKNTVEKISSDLNVIPIIHKDRSSIFSDSESQIGLATSYKFVKAYEKADKTKDIHIIIHTPGGAITAVEAIVNCIINHPGPGRFIAHIPYYAYSGGCAIALACHEIRIHRNAVVGPCDGQMMGASFKNYSVSSIMHTVSYKTERSEPIREDWIALSRDAGFCQERQRKFLRVLVDKEIIPEAHFEKVYEELFSGKYNHDMAIRPQEIQEMGLNVMIEDTIPEYIQDLF